MKDMRCFTCAFKYSVNGDKQTPYCALKRFPILNPQIGCNRHMYKHEFKNLNDHKEPDEIAAYLEAKDNQERFEI